MAKFPESQFRYLSNDFIAAWENNSGSWKAFYETHRKELFLGIRLNYINLYYHGARISKIELKKGNLSGSVNPKYIGQKGDDPIGITPQWLEPFETVKKRIDTTYLLGEKETQHEMAVNTNLSDLSEWYCVDIEYIKSTRGEPNAKGKKFGRFDIIAVKKEHPGETALIELKRGAKAIGGSSGVYAHTRDFYKFWSNADAKDFVKKNICNTITCLQRLNLCPLNEGYADAFMRNFQPKIYFIAVESDLGGKADVQKQMQKYLLDVPGRSKGYNVAVDGFTVDPNEGPIKLDVTKKSSIGFQPQFLFTNDDGTQFHDLLDHDNYQKHSLTE